jgi:hypothetical protein
MGYQGVPSLLKQKSMHEKQNKKPVLQFKSLLRIPEFATACASCSAQRCRPWSPGCTFCLW